MQYERKDLNKMIDGRYIQNEYQKYCNYCKSKNKKPRNFYKWNYFTYFGFEESWRLNH